MTRYHYPTWADIIGRDWGYYENWGRPGAGNSYIFNSIMECHSRNHLTADDTVLILWSSISRIDGYQYNDWIHHHSLFPDNNEYASCPRGYEIQSYAWMHAIDLILDQLPCQYYPMTWMDYDTDDSPGQVFKSTLSNIKKINLPQNHQPVRFSDTETFQRYWQELYDRLSGPDWPSLEKIRTNDLAGITEDIKREILEFQNLIDQDKRWKLQSKVIDKHPTPKQHLDIVEHTFPDFVVSDVTKKWVASQDLEWFSGSYKGFDRSLPKERL